MTDQFTISAELDDIHVRIQRIDELMSSDIYRELPEHDRDLMAAQKYLVSGYAGVLKARLRRLGA